MSYLVYDLLFLLYSSARKVEDKDAYLEMYPHMLVYSDGEFTSGGYAPDFVKDWINARMVNRKIIKGGVGGLVFTNQHIEEILKQLRDL